MNDFIKYICNILKIRAPKLLNDASHKFTSKTRIAEIDLDNNIIYLKDDKINYDKLFAIAHELRHLWQSDVDHKFYFSNYQPSDQLDIDEYNQQPAEVDANAFGGLVMEYLFNIYATWDSFSDETCDMIYDRMEEIEDVVVFPEIDFNIQF